MLLESLLAAAGFGLSLVLTLLSVLAYRRTRQRRLLLVSGAFLLFAARGAVLLAGLFAPGLWAAAAPSAPFLALDLLIMLLLYASVAAT